MAGIDAQTAKPLGINQNTTNVIDIGSLLAYVIIVHSCNTICSYFICKTWDVKMINIEPPLCLFDCSVFWVDLFILYWSFMTRPYSKTDAESLRCVEYFS